MCWSKKSKNKAKNYERNNWSGKCVKFSSVILHFPFSPVVIARLDKRIVRVNLISGIKRIPFMDRYRRSIITLHLLAEIQRRVDIGRSFQLTARYEGNRCAINFFNLSVCRFPSLLSPFFRLLLSFNLWKERKKSTHCLNIADILFSFFPSIESTLWRIEEGLRITVRYIGAIFIRWRRCNGNRTMIMVLILEFIVGFHDENFSYTIICTRYIQRERYIY